MPSSAIDDIFSGKVNPVADGNGLKRKVEEPTSSSTTTEKKRKKKKKNIDPTTTESSRGENSKKMLTKTNTPIPPNESTKDDKPLMKSKTRVVETVCDTSSSKSAQLSRSRKLDNSSMRSARKPKDAVSSKAASVDLENFNDSRGTGPRRKTEEGYAVYKENELGIGDEGGDTPLCPFDCNCCF